MDRAFLDSLRAQVAGQQGAALVARESATRALQSANDTYQQSIGAMTVLDAIAAKMGPPNVLNPDKLPAVDRRHDRAGRDRREDGAAHNVLNPDKPVTMDAINAAAEIVE